MGKEELHGLPVVLHGQHNLNQHRQQQSFWFCDRCSRTIGRWFSVKCVVVLILSIAVFLSALFWVLPPVHSKQSGFDAKKSIKLSATVQAYFKLKKPVSELIPHIARLEYDIVGEIGVPSTKVAVLSMHPASVSNWTNVVFGFLSDPMRVPINPVSLSVIKSSLIDLFLQQSNLTLTTSIFGQPSSFEILKFPGGITVIPESAAIWQIHEILFNFTLNNSIYEIKENLQELKEQLKLGLNLRPYENVYVQVTNYIGSTKDPPVTVEASIKSDMGNLLPQRLRQLAQTIKGSPPATNLGLDNSVFGKVKEVSLSSYLNHSLDPAPPALSPAPSPDPLPSASPSPNPSHSPSPSPTEYHPLPCTNCVSSAPPESHFPYAPSPENVPRHASSPTANSPAPSLARPRCGSRIVPSPSPATFAYGTAPDVPPHPYSSDPSSSPTPQMSPDLSPLPVVSYGSNGGHGKGDGRQFVSAPEVSPPISALVSSSTVGLVHKEMWWLCLAGLFVFHVLCWLS